jgi:hypothetical protein
VIEQMVRLNQSFPKIPITSKSKGNLFKSSLAHHHSHPNEILERFAKLLMPEADDSPILFSLQAPTMRRAAVTS